MPGSSHQSSRPAAIRTCRARMACSRRPRLSRARARRNASGRSVLELDAPARTTRVPAKRSWRPRRSRLKQRGQQSEAGRHGQHHPDQRAQHARDRSSEASGFVGRSPMPRHLPERLAAGGERDEVADVLDERGTRSSGPFGRSVELAERHAADLHREVDDGASMPARITRSMIAASDPRRHGGWRIQRAVAGCDGRREPSAPPVGRRRSRR